MQCFFRGLADAVTASPFTFRHTQPDGTQTPELQMRGDESLHFITDIKGYTVVKDNGGWNVYATEDVDTGELIPSQFIVGQVDPATLPDLKPGLKPHRERFLRERSIYNNSSPNCGTNHQDCLQTHSKQRRMQQTPAAAIANAAGAYQSGSLKHLVILIKFSNHDQNTLPPRESYDILFNQAGGDPLIAPTGSVRDIYDQSSYGKLTIDSTVLQWMKLPYPESYYANGVSGLDFKLSEALNYALNEIDVNKLISFQDFDVDKNGVIDSITFIHSGFGAEWGGVDCSGATVNDRIWSHQRADAKKWCGHENVCMERYQIATGLWGRCSSEITHIGVVGHEIGHFLGLNDMYDTNGVGKGIGSFSLMGNCWGFDQSQRHPPPLDAWSKMFLGWVQPTVLTESGRYTIRAIVDQPEMYIIKEGFPQGEYLIIENRQPIGFDSILPQGGLLIWHVDERASYDTEGFPGQQGWPDNGNHYKVALLQADGLYNLEKGDNTGDAGDVWHGGGVHSLGPSVDAALGPFPNTDSYKGGALQKSGIEIRDISNSAETMQFTLILPNSPLSTFSTHPPTQSPLTAPPTRFPTKSPVTSLPTRSPQTSSPTKSPLTRTPTKSYLTLMPTKLTGTTAPTKSPLTATPTKSPQTARRTRYPTKAPNKKPSSHLTILPPFNKKRTLSPSRTSAPSITPSLFHSSAPTNFNFSSHSFAESEKLMFAELPVFRLELIFASSPERHVDVKILINYIAKYIDREITQHYSKVFGPSAVNADLVSFTSNASEPVTQARGRSTLSSEVEMASVVEFKTIIKFYNGSLPQIEDMTNFLISSFNGIKTSEEKGLSSFTEYLKNSSDPVIASSEFVKAVVVTHTPQSTSQDSGNSSRTKFTSTAWLFALLGITVLVFASAAYYAVGFKGESFSLIF